MVSRPRLDGLTRRGRLSLRVCGRGLYLVSRSLGGYGSGHAAINAGWSALLGRDATSAVRVLSSWERSWASRTADQAVRLARHCGGRSRVIYRTSRRDKITGPILIVLGTSPNLIFLGHSSDLEFSE